MSKKAASFYIEDSLEELPPVIEKERLIYAGRECYILPEKLYAYHQKITALDLSFNHFKDLEGLQHFHVQLQELVLDNNEIDETTVFPYLHKLTLLSICNNNVRDLYRFLDEIANKLPNLEYLSLLGNEACPDSIKNPDCNENDYLRYRKYVCYKLPKLKFLDSKKVTKQEMEEGRKQGKFLRVVKPKMDMSTREDSPEVSSYQPLPPTVRSDQNKSRFVEGRYTYQGKNSEGNRFIGNDQL